jgi:uncharacterized membrane protein (Fun14 family)
MNSELIKKCITVLLFIIYLFSIKVVTNLILGVNSYFLSILNAFAIGVVGIFTSKIVNLINKLIDKTKTPENRA